ncbi:hypothetical protein GCM10027425_07490 [Alteromonas gracilis]
MEEGAPKSGVAYLEKIAEVLEDGVLDPHEASALAEFAAAFELSTSDVMRAHHAFVHALAREAMADGKLTRDERRELLAVSNALDVPEKVMKDLLGRAEDQRSAKHSADLTPLPATWTLGEPLRVDDRVVFTGCDPDVRNDLVRRSEASGVRVMNGVARTTAMLVTDGSMHGTKLRRAHELGTRIVDPETYRELLAHLQPRRSPKKAAEPVAEREGVPDFPERTRTVPRTSDGGGPSPAQLRAWGRANGWTLGDRGRLPAELREAYLKANPREQE